MIFIFVKYSKTNRAELPLHKPWSFWAVPLQPPPGPRGISTTRRAIKLADVHNVGKFWGIVNSLAPPSSLQSLLYGVWKKGLDPTTKNFCSNGGRWVTTLDLANTADGQVVDEIWITSMLTLLSESIKEGGEHLMGASISLKRGCRARLSLWIDASTHGVNLGRQFHRELRRVAVDHRIALNEWHFEDFAEDNFTWLIKATVPPVPEEADECEEGVQPPEPSFMGLSSPLTSVSRALATPCDFMLSGLDQGDNHVPRAGGGAAPAMQGSVLKACLG